MNTAHLIGNDGSIADVALTGNLIRDFTSHPDSAGDGLWCAYAELMSGEQAVVLGRADGLSAVADSAGAGAGAFESVRGALIDEAGGVVFFATPKGGPLGIYDAMGRRILSMGDPLFGSTVVDFALNPVSINRTSQLAIRVKLASHRQLIVRADPVG